MYPHSYLSDSELMGKIKKREITFAGNSRLRIVGKLRCWSGRKMKKKNRIFFRSYGEALAAGYRPCGHCMKEEYRQWIKANI
jgi:methylphosphotriester-DNA--protein-cysteine methyltransferase